MLVRRATAAVATGLLGLTWPLATGLMPVGGADAATGVAAKATATCDGKPATIVGTAKADHLRGTTGHDVIAGLGGDDVIAGLGANDLICGGSGDDVIHGGTGSDKLKGGAGDDRLLGGADQSGYDRGGAWQTGDLLIGGGGDDYLDPGYQHVKGVDASGEWYGYDTVSYADAAGAVKVDLAAATATTQGTATGHGHDTIVWSRNLEIVGSPKDDTLIGAAGPDHLWGAAGDDLVEGRGGNDLLDGDSDTVKPPAGRDTVLGGTGDDEIDSETGRDTLDGGAGDDLLAAYGQQPVHLAGGDGKDTLAVDYGAKLTGLAHSSVDGGTGRDEVELQAGTWSRPPGLFRVDEVAGVISHTVSGTTTTATLAHTEDFGLEIGGRWNVTGTSASESVSLEAGGRIHATMGGGDDVVYGYTHNDWVDGGPGTDAVYGYGGDDTCLATEHRHSCHA